MGGYLGRARPRAQPPTVPLGEHPERRSPPLRRVPVPLQIHAVGPSLNLAGRLAGEDGASSPRHPHARGLVVVHEQRYLGRYPGEQARHLFLGVFSSVFMGGQQKPVPTVASSSTSRTSVILKVASAKGKATLRLALGQPVLILWSFLFGHFPASRRKETRVGAPEERAKEEKELPVQGERGEPLAKREEDFAVTKRPCDWDEIASPPSAFRRLVVNGVPSSFVPRPGPLKRDACYKNAANSLLPESQASFAGSSSRRNAIASSHSSSLGQRPRRKGAGAIQGAGGLPHAASSPQSQEPAKERGAQGHPRSSAAALEAKERKANKAERGDDSEGPQGQQLAERDGPSSADLSRPPRRRFPLLPCRRKDPLILPPPPELGFRVTAEDLDLEKRAAIQWLNTFLKDNEAKAQCN